MANSSSYTSGATSSPMEVAFGSNSAVLMVAPNGAAAFYAAVWWISSRARE